MLGSPREVDETEQELWLTPSVGPWAPFPHWLPMVGVIKAPSPRPLRTGPPGAMQSGLGPWLCHLQAPHSATGKKQVLPACQASPSVNLEVDQFLKESFVALAIAASPQARGTLVPSRWLAALGCPCSSSRPLPHGTGVSRRHPQQGQRSSSHGIPVWLGRSQEQALPGRQADGGSSIHPSRRAAEARGAQGSRDAGPPAVRQSGEPSLLLREPAVPSAFATVQAWPRRGFSESSVSC